VRELAVERVPQVIHKALADRLQKVGTDGGQQGAAARDQGQGHDGGPKLLEPVAGDDVVHDDLPDERRGEFEGDRAEQAEKAKGQRGLVGAQEGQDAEEGGHDGDIVPEGSPALRSRGVSQG